MPLGPQPEPGIASAVRAAASGLYPPRRGCELLISTGWLHRDDFTRLIHTGTSITDGVTELAQIDWQAAITSRGTGQLPRSGGEDRILRLAASIADGIPVNLNYALSGLDKTNISLVIRAVRHANGTRPGAHPLGNNCRNPHARSYMGRVTVSGLAVLMAVLGSAVAGCAPTAPTVAAETGTGSDFAFIEDSAISCASAESCLAVGTLGATGVATPIADAWNGKEWRPLAVRLPAGTNGGLNDVSCKAGSCLAIGSYSPNSGGHSYGLAVTWNGRTLKMIPAPPASGGENTIDGLSCVSARDCITMTSSMDSASSVIDTWNGSEWKAQPAGDPDGVAAGISTLSCVSAAYCVAGGSAPSGPGSSKPLLASWNGETITPMKVPAPAATDIPTDYGPPVIYAISCVSTTSCAAAGTYLTDSSATTGFGFTEVLSGNAWKESTITWPQGTSLSMLFGVSCTSAESCLAVGAAGSSGTGLSTAAVSYNGKAWVRQTDLPRHGNSDYFGDVSCPAANDCMTAGQTGQVPFYSATPIFGSWNGKSWKDA